MKIHTKIYDISDHLRTPEEMTAYLDACLEEDAQDAVFIAKARDDIERTRRKKKLGHSAKYQAA